MKKLLIIIVVLLAAWGVYYVLKIDKNQTNGVTEDVNMTTYSSQELGFEFDYKTGPNGYVLDERIPADIGEHVRTLILYTSEDMQRIEAGQVPVGGEGPAVITVSVFRNTDKQQALNWAESNIQHSNINLATSNTEEVTVGGANAVRYTADGLYASDNVVVTHGENVYVFVGQYIDADSDLKKDFSPLVESARFIPQPGQE